MNSIKNGIRTTFTIYFCIHIESRLGSSILQSAGLVLQVTFDVGCSVSDSLAAVGVVRGPICNSLDLLRYEFE